MQCSSPLLLMELLSTARQVGTKGVGVVWWCVLPSEGAWTGAAREGGRNTEGGIVTREVVCGCDCVCVWKGGCHSQSMNSPCVDQQ